MSELNANAVESFIEAVKVGADESASAFSRTFGTDIKIRPGNGGIANLSALKQKVAGEGLALLLLSGGKGIAIFIPSSTGLVPAWCANPDVTEKSKLATFSQEWGMNLIPEDFFPEDYKAALLNNAAAGLIRAELDADAGFLELLLTASGEEVPVPAYMIWPLNEPDKLLEEPKATEDALNLPPPPTFGTGGGMGEGQSFIGDGAPGIGFDPFGGHDFTQQHKRPSLDDLPGYSRSVLKVKVPVAAVLATARKPIKAILEFGVGSVIQFDKSCDELLDVEVGQTVVIGKAEAVKVGDKFGFRIHSILLPEERFRRVEVRREGEYRIRHDDPQIIGKAPIKSFDR